MEILSKLSALLPGIAAKWTALLSIALSALLYFLGVWLLTDTSMPPSLTPKLLTLLLAAVPLLLGSFIVLFFVVRKHIAEITELNEKHRSHVAQLCKPAPPTKKNERI